MGKTLELREVKDFIEKNGCILLSDTYINAHSKLNIKCKCGNNFYISYNTFKNGQIQCRDCGIKIRNDNKRLTYDYVKNFIEINSCSNYKLVSLFYKNNSEPLNMICNNGHKIKICFANFQQGRRCGICSGKNCQRDTQSLKEEIFNIVGNEYEVIGEFVKVNKKIKIKHNKCGHIWDIVVSSFLLGVRCPLCSHRSYAKNTQEFKDEVYRLVGKEYEVLSEYKNGKTHIKLKHMECNEEYYTLPNNFLRGRRCPICSKSKGERKIKEYLDSHFHEYVPQKEFDGLFGLLLGNLSYDFFLPKYNLLIEFQGEQHKHYVKGFHISKAGFEKQKEHDRRKKQYAIDNNIKLLEIWYWDYENIEIILENIIK